MKILLINGSPKGTKSNTYRLSKAFMEGISATAPAECEELTVRDLDIKPCLGCFGTGLPVGRKPPRPRSPRNGRSIGTQYHG